MSFIPEYPPTSDLKELSVWAYRELNRLSGFLENELDNVSDYFLEVSKGNVAGHSAVNKFGRSTNVDNGVDTDIWDGANSTDDVDIWVAPTQARTHQVASTSANDAAAGTGAQTVMLYGLTSWDADEVSETITMNGTTNVATSNQYVIIHRMKVITQGSAGPNAGKITATADTDATVTAQINAGEGQTQMAIYGIPSTKTAYLTGFYASANKGTISLSANITLLANPEPDSQLTGFLVKQTLGINTDGANAIRHDYAPYPKYSGPCILKLQANSSSNDTDVSGGFDLIMVDV